MPELRKHHRIGDARGFILVVIFFLVSSENRQGLYMYAGMLQTIFLILIVLICNLWSIQCKSSIHGYMITARDNHSAALLMDVLYTHLLRLLASAFHVF